MGIDFKLRKKIIDEIPKLQRCFQCGTCVSSCPAKIYSGHFSPREFILECLHGLQEKVINDDLWRCLTCHNCNERCPQDVNPYKVIVLLKNIAIREGLVSEEKRNELIAAFNHVIETGCAYPQSDLSKQMRSDKGLKPVKEEQLPVDKK